MALTFTYDQLKDKAEHFPATEDGKVNDKLHTLTWMAYAIGMGQITEKNVDEFWVRANLWQKVAGPLFSRFEEGKEPEPILVTKQDVVNAIGLHTNVSRITKTEFLKQLWKVAENG